MTTRHRYAQLAFGLMALLMANPAHAQFVPGNSSGTTIFADDAISLGNTTTLTGGVDVRQGDTRVLADRMEIITSGSSSLQNSDFSRVDAIGNFYYITPDQEVSGEKGVYTRVNDTFVVSGDVIFKQAGGNIVTGSTLYYNLKDQTARVEGTCKGRRCGSKGRVNILIKNTNDQTDPG